jgi:hypothetical protein
LAACRRPDDDTSGGTTRKPTLELRKRIVPVDSFLLATRPLTTAEVLQLSPATSRA